MTLDESIDSMMKEDIIHVMNSTRIVSDSFRDKLNARIKKLHQDGYKIIINE